MRQQSEVVARRVCKEARVRTRTDLLQVEVHVPDFRECVVDRKVDLLLVLEHRGGVGHRHGRGVARDRAFDLRLAGRHDASVEIHLQVETQGVRQRLQEALAVDDVRHPVVEVPAKETSQPRRGDDRLTPAIAGLMRHGGSRFPSHKSPDGATQHVPPPPFNPYAASGGSGDSARRGPRH